LRSGIGLKLRKDLLRSGISVFEYDWSVDEEAILEHAMEVATLLEAELVLGAELTHTAA
jgi:hypothetical protein